MKKILIVDDNEKNRTLIKDVLSYHGYEIVEAEDGDKGISAAKVHNPDLILMDMQMPVMDGFTAMRRLKDDPDTGDIKIIAVTSFAMIGDREKIMAAGADDYITKPVNTRELPKIVKKLLKS